MHYLEQTDNRDKGVRFLLEMVSGMHIAWPWI